MFYSDLYLLFINCLDMSQQGRRIQSSMTSRFQSRNQGQTRNIQGEIYEILGDRNAVLSWTSEGQGNVIVSGATDLSLLHGFKGALLALRNDFFGQGSEKISIQGQKRQQLDRRLLLLEHEIEGLLKRRINYSVKDREGGHRTMDYTGILNEKENQIVELQKKIQNLEERLRRASKRQAELEDDIARLHKAMKLLEKPNFSRNEIQQILQVSVERRATQEKLEKLQSQIVAFGGLVRNQFEKLRGQGIRMEFQTQLSSLLRGNSLDVSVVNGIVNLTDYRDRVVEVPVQDARTKHLIHMLAVQMKKYFEKYPKLKEECDSRLYQFFQQELIDIIEVDELQRVVEIVKYVPQVVKVENVYAYSSEKSRKVQFHLRVLIKALLEELEKLKLRYGAVLEIDEGVIGMINQQIMGVVDVDDILKVFRVVPKIVEVEKIVQKIVDRVIQIPQVVPIEKIVEKIIEVPRIQEVERVVHVPVEIIKYVDNIIEKVVQVEKIIEKVVQVPKIMEKVVERVVEVPKIVQIEVVREKIVQVERPTIVERVVNHTIPQIRQVQVVKQKLVPVQRVVERVVQVEKIIEKVVEKVITVPKIVQVEVIKEKIVKAIQYRNAREVINHVQSIPEIVEVIIEKPVPVIQTIEKIVEVPQTIEKIVQVQVQRPTLKEVRIIEEKIVYVDRIREVEKIVNHTVPIIKQVQKIVDKRIQVPFIQQRVLKVPEVITQIVVEKIEVPKIIEVDRHVDKIVEVNKIIEVEKPVNHYITQSNPVKIIVQKIVEVPRTIQRIKQVRVNIDKIIEKMVQVPKVVEVQKIVEKVVVVPRVIEKIVEVPQIVEKVVDRIIQNTVIQQVQKVVQVPVVQDRVQEIQVIKNIYQQVDRVVEKVVQKIIAVEKVNEIVKTIKEPTEKIVEVRVEVPREVHVDKIVSKIVEVEKVVEIDRPVTVAVQVPVPVDRIVEKLVPVEREVEKIVQVPQILEKIVQVRVEQVNIKQVIKTVERPVVQERIIEVEKIVPYITETIKEVPTYKQKVVEDTKTIIQYREVPTYVEKIVAITNQVPKVYEIQKIIEKMVQVPQIVELEINNPVLVKYNQVVECFIDRPIEIPIIHEKVFEVPTIQEKIVAVEKKGMEVKEIIVNRDKVVQKEVFISKTDIRNQVQTEIKTIDRFEEKIVPVFSTTQKIVQIPHVLEKIVEKIVIMPQVVEVLKYVHEIVEEETLGIAVGVDIRVQEARYKELYSKVRIHFETILAELRRMKISQVGLAGQIEIIEAFLIELDKLMSFARIVQIEKEKIVEKERNVPILVPTKDSISVRNELSLSLLVEKLIAEIKRIKKDNSNIRLGLDQDVLLIFFSEFVEGGGSIKLGQDLTRQLLSYKQSMYSKLLKYGKTWSTDHQEIFNTVLQERFLMANIIQQANLEIERAKSISEQRAEAYRMIKQTNDLVQSKYGGMERQLLDIISSIGTESRWGGSLSKLRDSFANFKTVISTNLAQIQIDEPIAILGDIHGTEGNFLRLQSGFRALEKENELLRAQILRIEQGRPGVHALEDRERIIANLRDQIVRLTSEIGSLKGKTTVEVNVSGGSNINVQQYELKIRTQTSRIQELESQLRTAKVEYEAQIRQKNNLIKELQQKLNKAGQSRVTTSLGQQSQAGLTPIGTSEIQKLSSSYHSSASSGVDPSRNITTTSNYQVGGDGRSATYTTSVDQTGPGYQSSTYQSGVRTYQSGTSGTSGILSGTSGTSGTSGYGTTSYTTSGMKSSGTYQSGSGLTSSGRYASGTYTSSTGQTGTGGTTGTTGTSGTIGASYTSSTGRSYGTGSSGTSGYQSYYTKKE